MIVHFKMLWKSIKLVALVFLILLMVVSMVFASAALGQWRVDVNVARQELAEQVLNNE